MNIEIAWKTPPSHTSGELTFGDATFYRLTKSWKRCGLHVECQGRELDSRPMHASWDVDWCWPIPVGCWRSANNWFPFLGGGWHCPGCIWAICTFFFTFITEKLISTFFHHILTPKSFFVKVHAMLCYFSRPTAVGSGQYNFTTVATWQLGYE